MYVSGFATTSGDISFSRRVWPCKYFIGRSFCRLNTSFIIKEVSVGAVQLSGTVTLWRLAAKIFLLQTAKLAFYFRLTFDSRTRQPWFFYLLCRKLPVVNVISLNFCRIIMLNFLSGFIGRRSVVRTLPWPSLSSRLFRRIVTFKGVVVVQYDYAFHIAVLLYVRHCWHDFRGRCRCVRSVDYLSCVVGLRRRIVIMRSVGKELRYGLRRRWICCRGRIRSVAIHRPLIKQQPIGVDGRKSSEYLLHEIEARLISPRQYVGYSRGLYA